MISGLKDGETRWCDAIPVPAKMYTRRVYFLLKHMETQGNIS